MEGSPEEMSVSICVSVFITPTQSSLCELCEDSVVGTERESPFWWLYKGHMAERKIFTAESLNVTVSMQHLLLNQLMVIVH